LWPIDLIMIRLGRRWDDLGPAWRILGTMCDCVITIFVG